MTAFLYPPDFYLNRRRHTAYAADRILAALPATLLQRNVADIGCGTGTFLAAALGKGSMLAHGVEGAWVDEAQLDDPRIRFHPHDLELPLTLPGVDLAISLEVAEHLSPERAPSFVAELATMAPAVLFSAAIPGQGGVGHRNEQWQSWWAALFAAGGMIALDVIRPAIWTDDAIPAWYRQNTVLYLRPTLMADLGLTATAPALLDTVHPAFWARANRELGYANALPESEVLRRQAEQAQQ